MWEMIKKLKNMDGFDIFIVGILSLFGITALLLVVALPIYTVASYQNKEVHQGTITDKYNKRQDKEDKFYIVLDDKQVIENSDLFFKGKFDSADIQARLKVGDKVKVKTIGYRIHFLNLYPVLYEVKKVDKKMIKQILRLLFLLAMYELGKYVTEQVYIMMTANDDVEAPSDYVFRAEVSE
ncbi:conserved hypothetical protein [Staphylococcus aureus subsp. aureus 58-424]|nr:conserved hypothetical protein [Staphylococcus aureus subsp. aureus 58-424]